jgi:hypothetical protein
LKQGDKITIHQGVSLLFLIFAHNNYVEMMISDYLFIIFLSATLPN